MQLLIQGAAGSLLRRLPASAAEAISCADRGILPSTAEIAEAIVQTGDGRNHRATAADSEPGVPEQANVFVLDGSSLELEHCPELVRRYPPAYNQHGKSHWPVLRMVVAHDVETGLAQPPRWGAMYGPCAVSEQDLAEETMAQLPRGATVLGDRNFGYSG